MTNPVSDTARYIEPCCYTKQLTQIMKRCEEQENGFPACAHFFSYSDWGAGELIPFMATHVEQCELTVCLVHPDIQTLVAIDRLMKGKIITDAKAGESSYLVKKLLLICQPGTEEAADKQREIVCNLFSHYMESGRAVYAEDNIGFRCIAVGNNHRHLFLQGSINQQPCNATQLFTLTTDRIAYEEAMEVLRSKARTKRLTVNQLKRIVERT